MKRGKVCTVDQIAAEIGVSRATAGKYATITRSAYGKGKREPITIGQVRRTMKLEE